MVMVTYCITTSNDWTCAIINNLMIIDHNLKDYLDYLRYQLASMRIRAAVSYLNCQKK